MFLTTGESAVGVARQDNTTLSVTFAAPMITDAQPALLTWCQLQTVNHSVPPPSLRNPVRSAGSRREHGREIGLIFNISYTNH